MKRRPEVLLTILLLLATTGVLGADLQEARDHKNHGRFDQAIEAYGQILEARPGDQVALRELAQVTSWSGSTRRPSSSTSRRWNRIRPTTRRCSDWPARTRGPASTVAR